MSYRQGDPLESMPANVNWRSVPGDMPHDHTFIHLFLR